jgi:ABC-type tungstate transport system substrate-binding protein
MELILAGIRHAVGLLLAGDPEVWAVLARSLQVSATATLVALAVGIPAGAALGLGASRLQMVRVVLREARLPMLAAVMAGFGGVISEIGASMMVGGNIKGHTRTLTTAMVLETGKGNFEVAIALALLLLGLVFAVNWMLTAIQQRRGW